MATTTTFATVQEAGDGVTRRDILRWAGSLAAASALAAAGATGLSDSTHARRRGKQRPRRRDDQPQAVSTRATEATALAPDSLEGDLAIAGSRCRRRLVCYPNGGCHHRVVCWV